MIKKIAFLALCALLAHSATHAQVMQNIYGPGAVLRQNSTTTIQGWYYPGSAITIIASWNPTDTIRVQTHRNGRFAAQLKTPAGSFTKHTVTINGQPLMTDVLVGELWLCSGQSNMQWSINDGITDIEKHAARASDDSLRIFQVPLCTADSPQLDIHARWTASTPQTMRSASAVGYFFARKLMRELGVPVGIVSSAWGGTAADSWTPEELTRNNPELWNNILIDTNNVWRDDRPGRIFNAMISPFESANFSGVLWYQGETNVPKYKTYQKLLSTMIVGWRDFFGNDTLPFYVAQIAPYRYNDPAKGSTDAAMLREAQDLTARTVPGVSLVVLSDLTENPGDIHPRNKFAVGERFADEALTNTYKKSKYPAGYPRAASAVKAKNGDIMLTFKELTGDLQLVSINGAPVLKSVAGLTVVDAKGAIHPATGKLDGRKLVIRAPRGVSAVEVRYCFDDATIGNLASSQRLPVAPFRVKF